MITNDLYEALRALETQIELAEARLKKMPGSQDVSIPFRGGQLEFDGTKIVVTGGETPGDVHDLKVRVKMAAASMIPHLLELSREAESECADECRSLADAIEHYLVMDEETGR